MRSRHRARQLLNAVNLTTPLGLLVGAAGRATFEPGPDGLVLGAGYRLPLPAATAFTVGNVVIGVRDHRLSQGDRLLRHEARHATQYAVFGLPFLPLYGLAALWSRARTGTWYAANVFERWAGLADGGYPTDTRSAE